MQQRIAEISGDGTAAGGRVRVQVTPAGMPTRLEIADDIELEGSRIADAVMSAVAEATAQAAARLRGALAGVVSDEALDAMLRGGVSDTDVDDVHTQIQALRGLR